MNKQIPAGIIRWVHWSLSPPPPRLQDVYYTKLYGGSYYDFCGIQVAKHCEHMN